MLVHFVYGTYWRPAPQTTVLLVVAKRATQEWWILPLLGQSVVASAQSSFFSWYFFSRGVICVVERGGCCTACPDEVGNLATDFTHKNRTTKKCIYTSYSNQATSTFERPELYSISCLRGVERCCISNWARQEHETTKTARCCSLPAWSLRLCRCHSFSISWKGKQNRTPR